jgi:2-amino-4-hydroxy-6-hydroxymethyldihydropteridine diphosphokinase
MGDRQANLDKAIQELSERLRITTKSSVYDSEPMYNEQQPRFLNMVVAVTTTISPAGVLTIAKAIESRMGRPPRTHNEPRIIDIDVLFYDGQTVNTPDLIIPHPRLAERAFVLMPLEEIAPDFVHPVTKKTVKQMLKALGEVRGTQVWKVR